MNNAQMSARVGLFFLLGLALIWVTFESLNGNVLDSDKSYELTARFASIKELKAGDEVRMAGVGIGMVKETRLNGRFAEALLQVKSEIEVPENSVATIAMAGLLGSNYVSLTLGSDDAPALSAGAVIRSEDTPDLNTVVSQIGEVGRKVEQALSQFTGAMGAGDSNEGLMGKINAMVDDNRSKLDTITSNLEIVTTRLRDGEGTLGKLLSDDTGYTELIAAIEEIRGAAEEAKTFMASAQGLVADVKSGQGTLGQLIYDGKAGEDIRLTAQNLRELSAKLNNGEGTLGRLINDDSLFIEAQNAVKKVNRAVDGMADQGPITAVGVAANSLF
ncbi:MlaD family protein [Synoicihabitans lomoniglobus]|uniref:MlaD family protein n=1 Tax=Synoicihabitans lomoniglobus TaxID=2909285 RepID=A0AAE9ZRH1_9BACT|nr:MlaD family protein [Opitutaceae bacterium LMO-M01]WED63900.1 MlaD family protein [Opitutaceae bacterium LMO-M01]